MKAMHELEWLRATDPDALLAFPGEQAGGRKRWLFACACCRRQWHLLGQEESRRAVEVAERFADGRASDLERQRARAAAWSAAGFQEMGGALDSAAAAVALAVSTEAEYAWWAATGRVIRPNAAEAARCLARVVAWAETARREQLLAAGPYWRRVWHKLKLRAQGFPFSPLCPRAYAAERRAQARLLRDLAGNPFRPCVITGTWLTADVRTLAEAAYEERFLPSGTLDPVRLGVLADALEEAGCTSEAILDHLRGLGTHVRGCWVVDALLDKR
jgi:hypothetical protein